MAGVDVAVGSGGVNGGGEADIGIRADGRSSATGVAGGGVDDVASSRSSAADLKQTSESSCTSSSAADLKQNADSSCNSMRSYSSCINI